MKLERVGPSRLQVTAHAYELAALVAAARWAVRDGRDALPDEAVEHLEAVLADYDAQLSLVNDEIDLTT